MLCKWVAGSLAVHVEVVEAVLRSVILLGVVHHRAHQLELVLRHIIQYRLHNESAVVLEHLLRHTHTCTYIEPVALHLDIRRLGHDAVGDALCLHLYLLELHVVLVELHREELVVLHLHHLLLGANHGEAQLSAYVRVH